MVGFVVRLCWEESIFTLSPFYLFIKSFESIWPLSECSSGNSSWNPLVMNGWAKNLRLADWRFHCFQHWFVAHVLCPWSPQGQLDQCFWSFRPARIGLSFHCSDPPSPDPLPQEQTRPELYIDSATGFSENKHFRWNKKASSPGSAYKDIFSSHCKGYCRDPVFTSWSRTTEYFDMHWTVLLFHVNKQTNFHHAERMNQNEQINQLTNEQFTEINTRKNRISSKTQNTDSTS